MLSKNLKEIIEASLVDGVLTDKERSVIKRKALLEGIDPDEIDVLLDAEVQKIEKDYEQSVTKVKKCPNCGRVMSALETTCPDCGYQYQNVEANGSVQKLNQSLMSVVHPKQDNEERARLQTQIVKNFPVPSTYDDVFELLFYIISKIPNTEKYDDFEEEEQNLADAWKGKYSEIMLKANVLFSGDETAKKKLDSIEAQYDKLVEADQSEDVDEAAESKPWYKTKLFKFVIYLFIFCILIPLLLRACTYLVQ